VSKRFGEVYAVRGLNIEIPDKEFLVFVGRSGCGKTASLRILPIVYGEDNLRGDPM